MKYACQINSYKGDGSSLEVEYKFCFLFLDLNDKTKNKLYFESGNRYTKEISFTLKEFNINDTCMVLIGKNNENYGVINLCLGTYGSAIWELTIINEIKINLTNMYNNTKRFFLTHCQKYIKDNQENFVEKDIFNIATSMFNDNRTKYLQEYSLS